MSSRAAAYLGLWVVLLIIIIARRAPEVEVVVERGVNPAPPFVIDLNRDPWHQLTLIDGIGETLARRIVRAREERGGFQSLEEVMALPGVPDRSLTEARQWLKVE